MTNGKLVLYLNHVKITETEICIPDYNELIKEEDGLLGWHSEAAWCRCNRDRIDARMQYVDLERHKFYLDHLRAIQKVNFNYHIELHILSTNRDYEL